MNDESFVKSNRNSYYWKLSSSKALYGSIRYSPSYKETHSDLGVIHLVRNWFVAPEIQ